MRHYHFKIGKQDNQVTNFYEIEDLRVKLNHAGMSVDDDTLYSCFISALPANEYALESRDLNLKQVYDRKEILNLVRSQYETMQPSFGKPKGTSDPLALVASNEGGKGANGRGRGRSGKGNGKEDGNGGNAGTDKSEGFGDLLALQSYCRYSNNCKVKLCIRCGSRGHDISKCASPEDMEAEITQEAVLAMMGGDIGDNDVETTAF